MYKTVFLQNLDDTDTNGAISGSSGFALVAVVVLGSDCYTVSYTVDWLCNELSQFSEISALISLAYYYVPCCMREYSSLIEDSSR